MMARQLIRLLGSRYGVAAVLLVLVLVALGVARTIGRNGSSSTPPLIAPATASGVPAATTSPGQLGDDSVATSESPEAPVVSPGADKPEVVAMRFTNAWLNKGLPAAAWFKGIQPYLTQRVITLMQGVDPASVPATAVDGPAKIDRQSASLVELTVPVRPGVLKLRLVATKGRWLVDAVDWERS